MLPLISQFGNQALRPQFTNSFETNYTRQLENGSITAGIFYRIIEDNISRYVRIDRTDVTSGNVILSYDNFDNTSAFGLELSTNYRPTKWWNINASFDLYSQTQRGITEILDTDDIQNATDDDIVRQDTEVDNVIWNLRAFNNFKVSKKLSFSLFAMYRGEEEGIQFTLTFIEVSGYNISLYNISVYSNLTKSMLEGGIFFQPKPFSLKGGSVNLETKGLDYHILNASGYGYSMVKINDKLSGHYTTEFNDILDFNNIFIKYYDPSDINNNRYKWNFINNISELTLLDEDDFRTDEVEIRHLETNVPSELPLLEL